MAKKDRRDGQTASNSQEIEADLIDRFGPVLSGKDLSEALGFPSLAAFRKALSRGTVPVQVFSVEGRRGKFALTRDVARWWAEQKANSQK